MVSGAALDRGLRYAVQIADALAAPTPPASFTVTSSRRTSWWPTTARPRSSTSASPSSRRRPSRRRALTGQPGPRGAPEPEARSPAPSPTCRPSRPWEGRSTPGPTSSPSARCSTRCSRAAPVPARLAARDALGHPGGGAGASEPSGAGPSSGGRAGHPALPAQGPLPPLAEHVRPEGRPPGPAGGLGVRPAEGHRRTCGGPTVPHLDVAGHRCPRRRPRGGGHRTPSPRSGPFRSARARAADLRLRVHERTHDLGRRQAGRLHLGPQRRGAPRHLGAAHHRADAARLTRDPAEDRAAALSPDGSRVVFRSDRDGGGLYVVPTLGGQERKLAAGGRLPRFSPGRIADRLLRDVGWTPRGLLPMFLVPAEGGTPRPFQPDFGVPDIPGSSGPIWSPDGRHLLFQGTRLKPPGRERLVGRARRRRARAGDGSGQRLAIGRQ